MPRLPQRSHVPEFPAVSVRVRSSRRQPGRFVLVRVERLCHRAWSLGGDHYLPVHELEFAEDLLKRAAALVSQACATGQPIEADSVEADILRSAWAFVGAAIDTYFHERVRRAMLKPPLSNAARKYEVTVGDVEDLVEAFLKDRKKTRPRVRLNNAVHKQLLTDTFQGSRNVERAFALIGSPSPWKKVATELGGTRANAVKNRLDRQYDRRNKIVHEGDFKPQSRPQRVKRTAIEASAVCEEIAWTSEFLRATDRVTHHKPRSTEAEHVSS